ncbi:DinB family protein [Pseudooceanicola marinus]|uniref:DinB family protein n=1 Tax=Pseudooceanicola marinus TaxID=396013 RepID=A0A1X6ZW08_9RHOB|nr:DinB family protein [Pseudooceanicola marinus]PJE30452.1 nuclease [Pseudooceanicola marinus]SLN63270.1 DinB family protein [Pseudooceanicola marinus]
MTDATRPYRLMALNNAWSNARFYHAMRGMGPVEFRQKRPGFFPSLRATMNHILTVDLYYIDALTGGDQGRALRDREETRDVAALAVAQAESDARLTAFCEALTPEMLAETRVTERESGPVPEKVERLLLHLFQHQIHHRGQAHVQLQTTGILPPQLDEFYLDYDRAPSARDYLD